MMKPILSELLLTPLFIAIAIYCHATVSKTTKDSLLKARVSDTTKSRVAAEAERRGESEAVILREAVAEYFAKRESPYERRLMAETLKPKEIDQANRPSVKYPGRRKRKKR